MTINACINVQCKTEVNKGVFFKYLEKLANLMMYNLIHKYFI